MNVMGRGDLQAGRPDELRADCDRCFGLCCVAPAFVASADFAIDKPHGEPCPNLGDDFRCGIHTQLRERGFRGCTVYDCLGAGVRVSQGTYEGVSWRAAPESADEMFSVYAAMRLVHEVLWFLRDARSRPLPAELDAALAAAAARTEALASGTPTHLLAADLDAHRDGVAPLLREVSTHVRGAAPATAHRGTRRPRLSGPDLIGADLRRADLRGAELRGHLLIAADLTGADLRHADLIGADLRDANLTDADLTGALYLTAPQLAAAKGDATTTLSPVTERPAHWPS